MGSKSVVDMIEASSEVHFSGFHMDGLDARNTETGHATTSTPENMHKQPFVIGKGCHKILFKNHLKCLVKMAFL